MVSIARITKGAEAPLQGGVVALLIFVALWLVGVLEAAGISWRGGLPVCLVAGMIIGRWQLRWLRWAAAALWAVAAIGVYSSAVPRLARPFVRHDIARPEAIDAIVVLSGSLNSRGLVSGEALDRLLAGLALRAQQPALPLVLTVVESRIAATAVTSQADQRAIVGLVPATGGVEWIDSVYSTRDEAIGVARLAMLKRWKRVAVVTSPMHTRRACATVEMLGVQVRCVAAPWRPAAWPARTAQDRLVLMQRLTYELAAWAQYRVTGWAKWS